MLLNIQGGDPLSSTRENQNRTPINYRSKTQNTHTTTFIPYEPSRPYESVRSKTHFLSDRNHLIASQPPKFEALSSKEKALVQLAQKLIHSITSQFKYSSVKGQKFLQIKASPVMLRRIDEIRSLITQMNENSSKKGQRQECKKQGNFNNHSANDQIKKHIERQVHIKKELKRLVELALERSYDSLGTLELLAQVSSVISSFIKNKEEQCRLQNENNKIRKHYIQEIQHCKEELRFIHEVIQEKQTVIDELQRELYQFKRNRDEVVSYYEEQDTFALDGLQSRLGKGNMKRSGSMHIIENSFNLEKQSSDIIQTLKPMINDQSPHKISTKTILVNPESHRKSKNDLRLFEFEQKKDQVLISTDFDSPNLKELDALLLQRIQESEQKLKIKSQRLAALDEQIVLLEENVTFLNDKIAKQQDDYCHKQRIVEDYGLKIKAKETELVDLQERVAALTEEQAIEEYNIDLAQQQLQFLQEQCDLLREQIEGTKINKMESFPNLHNPSLTPLDENWPNIQ